MNLFNSLGSNYNLSFVLKALFAQNKNSYREELVKFLEKKYGGTAILVYKGREAIGLALNILRLPKESFVAINGFTCFAVYKAVANEGYGVKLIDIDDRDLNFSAKSLGFALKQNPQIKVVIIQNTLGYPCDIEKIAKICEDNDIFLIEDLAHSVGTVYENGKEAGTIGDFVVLSFSQDKIIDAVSGGALIIRNKKYQNYPHPHPLPEGEGAQERARLLDRRGRVRGKQQLLDRLYPLFTFIIRKTYKIGLGKLIHFLLRNANLLSKPSEEGFYKKYSLPNWYCRLAILGFENLKNNLEHRQTIANIYSRSLNKKILSDIITKHTLLSSNLRFPIFVENRRSLIEYLKKESIYVSDIWYDDVDPKCPNCQIAANKIINLPTHINISEEDAKSIAQKINQSLIPPLSLRERARVRVISQNDGVEMNPTITTKLINNKGGWEAFLSKHPEANFLQSWYWGEFHINLGNKIQRTGFYSQELDTYSSSERSESRSSSSRQDGYRTVTRQARTIIKHVAPRLIGVMLSIVENAKRGRYLTVPGGPIIDWTASDLVSCFTEEIKKIARSNNCVFVRVRPQLESSDFSKNLFKQNGFINAPMHLHAELTSQFDITKDEETLLSQMRKTTRYEIKKAMSLGIEIKISHDPKDIKDFYELQIQTAKRQKFVPFSYEFLHEQFKVFSQNGKALLYEAKFQNKLLAYAFVIFYGKEAVYHYGASTEEGRGYPGAYLIQWEAILEAKKRGLTRYNFWGVAPENEPKHRFYGLSLFKRGFGGKDFKYLPAQDLIINKLKYLLNYITESIRNYSRNL